MYKGAPSRLFISIALNTAKRSGDNQTLANFRVETREKKIELSNKMDSTALLHLLRRLVTVWDVVLMIMIPLVEVSTRTYTIFCVCAARRSVAVQGTMQQSLVVAH